MGACLAKETPTEEPRSDENLDPQKSTTKIATLADLNAKISTAEGLVVIDFFAVWCPPCQNIAPCVDAMSKEFTSVLFLNIDADENEEACQKYNIEDTLEQVNVYPQVGRTIPHQDVMPNHTYYMSFPNHPRSHGH